MPRATVNLKFSVMERRDRGPRSCARLANPEYARRR
jgi:hypothetical protein